MRRGRSSLPTTRALPRPKAGKEKRNSSAPLKKRRSVLQNNSAGERPPAPEKRVTNLLRTKKVIVNGKKYYTACGKNDERNLGEGKAPCRRPGGRANHPIPPQQEKNTSRSISKRGKKKTDLCQRGEKSRRTRVIKKPLA